MGASVSNASAWCIHKLNMVHHKNDTRSLENTETEGFMAFRFFLKQTEIQIGICRFINLHICLLQKKCYFSSATVRNQRNIVIVGGSNHEISLS